MSSQSTPLSSHMVTWRGLLLLVGNTCTSLPCDSLLPRKECWMHLSVWTRNSQTHIHLHLLSVWADTRPIQVYRTHTCRTHTPPQAAERLSEAHRHYIDTARSVKCLNLNFGWDGRIPVISFYSRLSLLNWILNWAINSATLNRCELL